MPRAERVAQDTLHRRPPLRALLSKTHHPHLPLLLHIKAIPNARRDQIAGRLGDRLKIRVSAPPEAGRANQAICRLIAGALGVPTRDVIIIAGHTSPEKTLQISGASEADVARLMGD
jgi:uncharacterized protein